ncbi:MAG: hypothetical protein QOJ52_2994, partial [Acidimicrobiaceae bacterium]|nr:hypothetical protein [Acidimicrobiaceae bacterium]
PVGVRWAAPDRLRRLGDLLLVRSGEDAAS